MSLHKIVFKSAAVLLLPSLFLAQSKKEKKDAYEFKMVYQVKTNSVKDQGKTSTCWSFAATSFIETELLRMNKGEYNLSPMYNVRYAYPLKAENFIRYDGTVNFGNGGQSHDVLNVVKDYGIIPQEFYDGMKINEDDYNHGEMDAVLKSIVDAVIKNKGGKITPLWKKVFESTLNIYLGEVPRSFNYFGKDYTPKSFAERLGFNPEDYVEVTSYTHRPFYQKFELEVPDNWSRAQYYNIPINEFIHLIDTSLAQGYSLVWDGDTSEKAFNRKKGIAIIPASNDTYLEDDTLDVFNNDLPVREKFITQDMRQEAFDNHTTTDDHLMHIVGMARDQRGYKFYYVKDSFGIANKKYDGYIFMSEIYARLKTIAITVNKNAIPPALKTKLGL